MDSSSFCTRVQMSLITLFRVILSPKVSVRTLNILAASFLQLSSRCFSSCRAAPSMCARTKLAALSPVNFLNRIAASTSQWISLQLPYMLSGSFLSAGHKQCLVAFPPGNLSACPIDPSVPLTSSLHPPPFTFFTFQKLIEPRSYYQMWRLVQKSKRNKISLLSLYWGSRITLG